MTSFLRIICHLRISLRLCLHKLTAWLWRVTCVYIWRRMQRIKSTTSRPDHGHANNSHTNPWDFALGPHIREQVQAKSSPCYGLHEPTPFITLSTPVEDPGVASDDSSSEFEFRIDSPEHPPSGSGDLILYPNSQQDQATPPEIATSWNTLGLMPNHLIDNSMSRLSPENRGHHRSIHSSHSSRSSLSSFTSSRDISLQTFQRQTNDSRLSVIVENATLGGPSSQVKITDYVRPLIPSNLKRYGRKRPIATREDSRRVRVLPNTRSFGDGPDKGVLPEGWVQLIHPEGQPTFYNKAKNIITESWTYNNEIYQCLEYSLSTLTEFIQRYKLTFPADCHFVLEIDENIEDSDQDRLCGYYYVSHSTRVIFWLENTDITELFVAESEVSEVQIKLQLEYQYWCNWSLFPDVSDVTLPILDMMANHMSNIRTDLLTSPDHTPLQFNLKDVKSWEVCVQDARKQLLRKKQPTSWFVGRFMSLLCQSRFYNFHGKYGARLSRTQTVYDLPKRPQTYLIKILSPLLFSAPDVHLKIMEGLWVDKLTLRTPWSKFFIQLLEEWKNETAYASLLLNANVAFLAIPSNDRGGDFDIMHRSPAQIASYLSVMTSSASMLLGLLLVRQYKTRDQNDTMDQSNFLVRNDHQTRGFEALAILYSLPYALLVWGLVTFFIAFFFMCFQSSDAATRSVVGTVSFFAAILIVWCIWKGWEGSQNGWCSTPLTWVLHRLRRNSKLRRRVDENEDSEVPERSYHTWKNFGWIRLRQLWWKAPTTPDMESHPPVIAAENQLT